MTTRPGNAGDFHLVLPMMQQHRLRQRARDPALYAPHPDAEGRFLRWIGTVAQDPRTTLLVVEEQGRVVGFLYATIERELPPVYLHEEFALVREWWVEPAFRGRGAGRALIERAAADLARAGVRQLRVRVAAGTDDAADDDDGHDEQDVLAVLNRCGYRTGARELVRELHSSRNRIT